MQDPEISCRSILGGCQVQNRVAGSRLCRVLRMTMANEKIGRCVTYRLDIAAFPLPKLGAQLACAAEASSV